LIKDIQHGVMLVTKSYSAGPKTIYNFAFISAIALHMVTLFLWFI